MAIAQEIITRALRLIGQVQEGETPSPEMSVDGLESLNDMLESWSNERLMVYQILQETLSWASGQPSRTIGSTGNFDTTRPIKLEEGSFIRVNGEDYPVQIINRPQYDRIGSKSSGSTIPEFIYYDPQYPLGVLYLYPVPSATVSLYLNSWKQLAALTELGTAISFPPGYARALRYNLAVEMAPEYGVEPLPSVTRTASKSRAVLKRTNAPMDVLSMPAGLVRAGGSDIMTDR